MTNSTRKAQIAAYKERPTRFQTTWKVNLRAKLPVS